MAKINLLLRNWDVLLTEGQATEDNNSLSC